MKTHVKEFCKRGAMFAWGGPVVLAVVWFALEKAGVIQSLTVGQGVLGILSTTAMAFVAAGISVVYGIESLPKAVAGLIQMAVLYLDYLGFYLLNGWIPLDKVWVFTAIFVAGFVAIWLSIYVSIRVKVTKMNRAIINE